MKVSCSIGLVVVTLFFCFFVIIPPSNAQASDRKPVLWAMPPDSNNGQQWRELFQSPDQWVHSREGISVLGYADHSLNSEFKDDELRADFADMKRWHIPLGLEVGAIKPWGITGEAAFNSGKLKWDRFLADGADLQTLAMDEPLAACHHLNKSPEYAAEQTAIFVALVRKKYPNMRIGDIEPYPGPAQRSQELLTFIDAVQSRLAEMHVRGLDFFRLDTDFMHFHPGDPVGVSGWNGVHQLEVQMHQRHLPFSLVYWAAGVPSLQREGKLTPMSWENSILKMQADYRATGGRPDEFVVESWIGVPPHAVPDNTSPTFMHSVLSFENGLRGQAPKPTLGAPPCCKQP